jgi:hypothetical protein
MRMVQTVRLGTRNSNCLVLVFKITAGLRFANDTPKAQVVAIEDDEEMLQIILHSKKSENNAIKKRANKTGFQNSKEEIVWS